MPLSRESWQRERAQQMELSNLEARVNQGLSRLRQAAVPMERLTGMETWDTFLRYAEQIQADARVELEDVSVALCQLSWKSSSEIAALRHRAAILTAMIQARQQVLDLPKSILQTLHDTKENMKQ